MTAQLEIGEELVGFFERFGRAADRAMLARELAEGVPQDHERHFYFLGTEADALWALGLTGEAVQRWRRVLETLERRSAEQPERADYQGDLVVSLVRIGTRESLERALMIACRLEAEDKLSSEQSGWVRSLEQAVK